MREQRALVELEVRRPDHGDSGGTERGRMPRQLDGGGRRLRAGMDDHVEAAPCDEELGDPLPLLDAEEDPLPRRPEREQAVQPAGREELDQRARKRPRRGTRRRPSAALRRRRASGEP